MHDFTELDRIFNTNTPEKYHLSIQLQPDGFSFCILDIYLKRYIGVKHIQLKKIENIEDLIGRISEIIVSESLLNLKYKSTSLINVSRQAFLVPGEIFVKEEVANYFKLNGGMDEFDEVHFNYLPLAGSYNVFSIHHELLNVFRQKFENLTIYHHWSPLVNKSLKGQDTNKANLVINFNATFIDMVCCKDNKLKMCNIFEVVNENDFVFYILNVLKQLQIETEKCNIILTGDMSNRTKWIELLGRFISHYKVMEPDEDFSYSHTLKNISRPVFYNLYNSYHCVLSEENSRVKG